MSKPETEKIIGIDLGTTNSAAAIMEAGRPVVIPKIEPALGQLMPHCRCGLRPRAIGREV